MVGISKGTLYYHYKNKMTFRLTRVTDRYLDEQYETWVTLGRKILKGTPPLHRLPGKICSEGDVVRDAVRLFLRRHAG